MRVLLLLAALAALALAAAGPGFSLDLDAGEAALDMEVDPYRGHLFVLVAGDQLCAVDKWSRVSATDPLSEYQYSGRFVLQESSASVGQCSTFTVATYPLVDTVTLTVAVGSGSGGANNYCVAMESPAFGPVEVERCNGFYLPFAGTVALDEDSIDLETRYDPHPDTLYIRSGESMIRVLQDGIDSSTGRAQAVSSTAEGFLRPDPQDQVLRFVAWGLDAQSDFLYVAPADRRRVVVRNTTPIPADFQSGDEVPLKVDFWSEETRADVVGLAAHGSMRSVGDQAAEEAALQRTCFVALANGVIGQLTYRAEFVRAIDTGSDLAGGLVAFYPNDGRSGPVDLNAAWVTGSAIESDVMVLTSQGSVERVWSADMVADRTLLFVLSGAGAALVVGGGAAYAYRRQRGKRARQARRRKRSRGRKSSGGSKNSSGSKSSRRSAKAVKQPAPAAVAPEPAGAAPDA